MVPGIEDDNYVNFDHVPVWYEPVGNHLWGPKGILRNVSTAVKEKYQITVVLAIANSGRKLPLFIIFKCV